MHNTLLLLKIKIGSVFPETLMMVKMLQVNDDNKHQTYFDQKNSLDTLEVLNLGSSLTTMMTSDYYLKLFIKHG